ncbi:MAG: CotH kinase family protein [Clostridia bacterium]|nr:CotH kinase family protein [Clostridia bacterium]
MKGNTALLSRVILIILLFSCISLTAPAEGEEIGRIVITTVHQGEGAMDFVMLPVAGHVSKQIATWTPDYVFPPEPYYEDCLISVYDESGEMVIDEEMAEVKVRGNWTTSYPKKPLRIRFDKKQSMLDLNGGEEYKNWNLLAEYKDGSMLRNKTALTIANGILAPEGLYASDCKLVEVEINGEYMGVYLLTEHQQVNEGRVEVNEPEKDYEATDIGYFLEFDAYAENEPDLNRFSMSYAGGVKLTPFDGNGGSGKTQSATTGGITIKSDIYSFRQRDFIADYVNDVFRILYNAAYRDEAYIFNDKFTRIKRTKDITPQEAVERVINVDSLACMYIINEIACDADIYMSGVFMSADFSEGGDTRISFHAPWDFDSALGNKNRCINGTGFHAANIVYDVNDNFTSINPWMAVLIYEDWFREIIMEKWTEAYDAGVFDNALCMISDDAERYADAFTRNYDKWNNLIDNGEFAHELSQASKQCVTHKEAADSLYAWLKARIDFLNEQFYLAKTE